MSDDMKDTVREWEAAAAAAGLELRRSEWVVTPLSDDPADTVRLRALLYPGDGNPTVLKFGRRLAAADLSQLAPSPLGDDA